MVQNPYQNALLPAPVGGGYSDPDYWIWCGFVVQGEDGAYHMFASRWPLHKATILRGGIRKSNQAPKYVKGFRLYDKVLYQRQECFIWGRRTTGSFLLKLLDGTKVKDGVSCKHLKLLERSSQYLAA